jgi:hypothetical protein
VSTTDFSTSGVKMLVSDTAAFLIYYSKKYINHYFKVISVFKYCLFWLVLPSENGMLQF